MTGAGPIREMAGEKLTRDGFLGGRLAVWQPARGYRAGVDPVLLAAAVPAEAGQSVLELGCGAGVASLCLGARVPGLALTGIERQVAYAALARRNAEAARLTMAVVTADLAHMPAELRERSFEHVIANPPYLSRGAGPAAADMGREAALGEATPLAAWIDAGTRRLRPRGRLSVILRADRLADLLDALDARLGSVTVQPIQPRMGGAASLAIVSAIKGGRGAFRLLAPLTLHDGHRHARDGEDYAPWAQSVLRDGAALPASC